MIVNGYKPLSDWYVLGAICFVMFAIGFIASSAIDPLPRKVEEIMVEISRCHRQTQLVCSIMVMPDDSQAQVYLLYSEYVK